MKKYMNHAVLRYYYNEIKESDDAQSVVDDFWLNVLLSYFRGDLNFGVESARSLPEIIVHCADCTIRPIRYGDSMGIRYVTFVEGRQRSSEAQWSDWETALAQLTEYLKLVRTESAKKHEQTLYGAACIGRYTRFYQLNPSDQQCVNYPGTSGNLLELAEDESMIHKILSEIVEKTSG
ncbi:MAG: hypothetical protein MMC23_001794 [Stictis urceolatum]|nr:hypothetical protein [Stictis urceolata]